MAAVSTAQTRDVSMLTFKPPRTTIGVSVWSLWRDKDLTIAPLQDGKHANAQKSFTTVRLCQNCEAHPLSATTIRATQNTVAWTDSTGRARTSTELLLYGSYRLSAHNESLALPYPLQISVKSGALLLTATLPVERYVELVVASESGPEDSAESLKALAVVARTFALQSAHGHTAFDVCDSTHCQWVHWRTTPAAHAATLATADESLWFHGQRAQAYFHQNCGGHTASAAEVWPNLSKEIGHGQLPFPASRQDNYCTRTSSSSSEWSANLSRAELTQALASAGLVAPGWKALTVTHRGESGRAVVLRVGSSEIAAEDFRLAVGRAFGWDRIRSNWFEIAATEGGFLFHGRGSGHGVGLCQVGAAEMAREGRSDREILSQYFPGAVVADEATGSPWQTLAGKGFTLQTSEASDAAFLPALAQALAEAESRSGLAPSAIIDVRTYRSTPAYRDATLTPGWVAAFTEGDRIAVQPLCILAARKLLTQVMRHEFMHALVEAQSTARTPLWLREGLVETWSGDKPLKQRPTLTLEAIDDKLVHSANESESEAAHRAAGWYAQQLLNRFGRAQVLGWLRVGLPQPVLDSLRQRIF
jgi:stage II sporulation protein D